MRALACALLLAAATAVAGAGMQLEVIELEHRLARDLIPLVEDLAGPGATVTGTGNRLIVRTTPERLAQIHEVLATLDTRVRQLRVSVAQGRDAAALASGHALGARIEAGDVAAGVGTERGRGSGVEYRSFGTSARDAAHATHFVLVMEGQPAFIETGQDLPLPYTTVAPTPYGPALGTGIEYRNVGAGFYATPRVHGDEVTVEIAHRLERVDPRADGGIDVAGGGTAVTGRLGEWIPIGGALETATAADSELLASTRRAGDNAYSVWIKIEEQQ